MKDYAHKEFSLAVTVFYSLLLHALALTAFLTIPLYSGESRQSGTYMVTLESPAREPDIGGGHPVMPADGESVEGEEPVAEKPAQDETKAPVIETVQAEEAAIRPRAPESETVDSEAEAAKARAEVEHADDSGPEAEKSVRKPRTPKKKTPETDEEEMVGNRPVVAKKTGVAEEPAPVEEMPEEEIPEEEIPEPVSEDTAPAMEPREEEKAIEPAPIKDASFEEPVEDAPPEEAPRVAKEVPSEEEPAPVPAERAEIEPEEPEEPGPVKLPEEALDANQKIEAGAPLLEPASDQTDDGQLALEETLDADAEEDVYEAEQRMVAYEKPGWQEPDAVRVGPEEAKPAPVDTEAPAEPEPVPEKQDIESPAGMPLEAESPAPPDQTVDAGEDLCEDCDLVSRLYENPLEIVGESRAEERQALEKTVEATSGTAELAPVEELCEDCGPIASLYENPVVEMMRHDADSGVAEGSVLGTEGGMTSEKSVDMLCAGCLFLAMLEGNSAEEIIYEDEPQGRVPEGFLSPMEEFCRNCRQPSVEAEVVKAVVWEISGDSAEIVGPPEAADRKGLVLDVPQGDDFVAMEILRGAEAQKGIAMEVRAPQGDAADLEKGRVGVEPDAEALDVAPAELPGDVTGAGGVEEGVAEIFTPRVNRIPSRDDYIAALDEDFRAEEEPEEVDVESPGLSLPLNIAKDIAIRVFFSGGGEGLSFRLLRGPHPMASEGGRETEDLTGELEKLIISRGDGLRRIFSLSKAGKGLYRFNIDISSGEKAEIEVEFILHGGLRSEKKKNYEGLHVAKDTSYAIKFIMPEAVFWDDEDYFTGEIEGPSTMTKFNDETGLVWKEKKTGR